jgi:hypothetical protein
VYEGDVVDLVSQLSSDDYGVAYALAYVSSPDDQEVTFRFMSDDAAKIWLDDSVLYDVADPRLLASLDLGHRIPCKLTRGLHKILIKIENAGGPWGFAIDAENPDGLAAVLDWSASPPGKAQ